MTAATPAEGASPHIDLTTSAQPGRLRVGIIGAGRVGVVLGAALAAVGHRVTGATAVSDASHARLEALLPGVPVKSADTVGSDADLVLVTVPDDVLASLVDGLASVGAWQSGQLVVHTSGRHGLSVLDAATQRGALPLALHPVMTFTGTSMDLQRLSDCVFGVTAPAALYPVADALVWEMGGEPMHVADEARPLYHAALAHASNHLMSLVTSSMDLLSAAGVEDPARVLEPLLTASLDNALRRGDKALTGPVARGDVHTVTAHLEQLHRVDPATADAYRALALLTTQRALRAGLLTPAQADELRMALGVSS